MAGSHLTDYLSKLLTERGHAINSSTERAIVRDVKEKHCYVAQDYDKEQILNVSEDPTYELPDGRNILLSNERFHCPEALFKPSLLGLATPGVHQMLFNSITKCETDLRLHYFCNVMLSGGTSQLPGFRQRVENEIQAMAPSNVRVRTYQLGADSAWIGGPMAASLSTFQQTCISKKEYEESGAAVVHRDS